MSGRTHTKRFRIRTDSVRQARLHVEILLAEWKVGHLADVASLVVSELATNVVNHAKGAGEFFELSLRRTPAVLVLEVSDSCQWRLPEQQKPGPDDTSGRGLLIVDALSDSWGVRPRATGKTVWVHLRLQGREGGDRGARLTC